MFDYRRAHTEIAAPLYRALPRRILRLVGRVQTESADLSQKPDLDMPWPPGLREAFERVDTSTLAHAAQVVHDYGHWGTHSCCNQRLGTYWKFSNYCDQIIRARLGLGRDGPRYGVGFVVHEGQLRVCYSGTHVWTWEVIGPASKGLLRSAKRRFSAVLGLSITEDYYQQALRRQLKAHPVGNLSDYGA